MAERAARSTAANRGVDDLAVMLAAEEGKEKPRLQRGFPQYAREDLNL